MIQDTKKKNKDIVDNNGALDVSDIFEKLKDKALIISSRCPIIIFHLFVLRFGFSSFCAS